MKKYIIFLGLFTIIAMISWHFFHANPQQFVQTLLSNANISISGHKPSDVIVFNDQLYAAVISKGSLGLGESYMDGWWDCPALDQFFCSLSRAQLTQYLPKNVGAFFAYVKAKVLNMQSKSRAFEVGQKHYDLGNDLFQAMLDKNMLYSCAYWKDASNLDQAQENKCRLICQKLHLQAGMSLLDIGCGWGGFAKYAAKNYGVHVVGVTVSEQQAAYAREINKGYPVEIRLQDYRTLQGSYDRIVSIGMFEHVGVKNYKTFMQLAHSLLKPNGLLLLHTIGGNISQNYGDAWLNKYIFPNGMLPSIEQIAQASQGKLVMEDWHNFGADYDTTLMSWARNFERAWPQLKSKYDDRFYRMWKYYLLSCAGLFRSRVLQLWQIVFSKEPLTGYNSIR